MKKTTTNNKIINSKDFKDLVKPRYYSYEEWKRTYKTYAVHCPEALHDEVHWFPGEHREPIEICYSFAEDYQAVMNDEHAFCIKQLDENHFLVFVDQGIMHVYVEEVNNV